MEPTAQERTNAMLCHLLAFCGYFIPFGNIIGPLVMWQMKGKESGFVNQHGKESLNFQLSMLIYFIIAGILTLVAIGFLLLMILAVINLIFLIIASIKANDGAEYRYPMKITFLR